MPSLPTPNYVLTEEVKTRLSHNWQKDVILPAGTFVRPVELCYLPSYLHGTPDYTFFKEDSEAFCYTSKGFVVIPLESIRRT